MTPTVFYTGDENFKSSRGSQQHVQIETGEELLHGGPEGIAIIGFSLEFPQDATSSEGFWKMMAEKRCAMTEFPPDRLNIDAFYHPDPNRGDSFSFRGGHFITKDLAAFDANFFTISPSEAAGLDPAHRRLLETSYKAFENAGISMESLSGSNTSVHTACFTDDYKQQLMKDIPQLPKYASTGTAMAMLANRLSWFYNLTGQSSNVDTACSSSVLAIDQACQLLRNNDCDMSIVAGCNINYTPEFPNLLSKMSFLSPDSRCYSFDDRANGYARGEGIAVIVLKRISDAIHDNDTIRAVIRSSGSNQDGFTPGITQPSSQLQERLIRHTYQKAGLSMKHTRFFEAHGTGTAIGDPIEASAIGNAFRQYRTSQQPLFVGSVKSNIGHLEAASGLSGLIKSILMLETGIILPNANFKQLNPRIDSEYLRISIPTKTIQWPAEGVRRVSLNSFGFGGSNCHLVVDDALHYLKLRGLRGNHRTAAWPSSNHLPLKSLEHLTKHEMSNPPVFEKPAPILASSPKLMIWSASDKAGVLRLVKSYEQVPQQLHDTSHNTLEDIAYTLGSRRSTLPWKSYAIVTSLSDFEGLERTASTPVRSKNTPPRLGFLFSGQGGQWYDMGRGLLAYSTFKATVQELDFYLAELGCPWSLECQYWPPLYCVC
jgi:acyl transferase domain-containing protein